MVPIEAVMVGTPRTFWRIAAAAALVLAVSCGGEGPVPGLGPADAGGGGAGGGPGGDPGGDGGGGRAAEWPPADPAVRGPYETVIEHDVGPGRDFTLFRPAHVGPGGRRHPVVVWGNGTGVAPRMYAGLLEYLASHGFVVAASNRPNVLLGSPPYMIQALDWVLAEGAEPGSVLFGRLDTERVAAVGHSIGGFAACDAAADPRVGAIVAIQGARATPAFAGPVLLLCGGEDGVMPCADTEQAFEAAGAGPVMFANLEAAGHTDWLEPGELLGAYATAVTGWLRVHLMDDAPARSMFYGECSLCEDDAWEVRRKNMDG